MQLSGISEPQRHYFIDDSVLNVKGAQVHGWNAWHFDEDGTGQLPEGSVAGSVRSLQDLRSAWKQFVSQ
ncbi:putative suppressor of disruption of TFIIS [Cystobasidiomycetes sp. EMM_F5]